MAPRFRTSQRPALVHIRDKPVERHIQKQWIRSGVDLLDRPLTEEERLVVKAARLPRYDFAGGCFWAASLPILCAGAGGLLGVMGIGLLRGLPLTSDSALSGVILAFKIGFVVGLIAYFWPLIQGFLIYLDLRAGTAEAIGFEVQEVVAVLIYYDPAYYPDADTLDPDDLADEWEVAAPWAYLLDLGAGRLLWVMVGCDGVERSWLPGRRVELARSRYGNVDLGLRAIGEPLPPTRTVQLLPVPEGTLFQGVIIRGTAATLKVDVREAIRL